MRQASAKVLWLALVLTIGGGGARLAAQTQGASTPTGCRVTLEGTGQYRLSVTFGSAVPTVSLTQPQAPVFTGPTLAAGEYPHCDESLGSITVSGGRDGVARLAAGELFLGATRRWSASQAPGVDYAFRDFRLLADEAQRYGSSTGFAAAIQRLARDLVARYTIPGVELTTAGARWVAEAATTALLEGYVAGQPPAMVARDILSDITDHLQATAGLLVGNVTDAALGRLLRPRFLRMAFEVEQQLRALQGDQETVTAVSVQVGTVCSHRLEVAWELAGGTFRGMLTIACSPPQTDWIASVKLSHPSVEPGKLGRMTAEAQSRRGFPVLLASAASTGIAPVLDPPPTEPTPAIAGAVATFAFTAAEPRHDRDYPVRIDLRGVADSGAMAASGRGMITVLNVAPVIEGYAMAPPSAKPGEQLVLDPVSVTVRDRNADRFNPGEVDPLSLGMRPPAKLRTSPLLDKADGVRTVRFDPANGRYDFRFRRTVRVDRPHAHGTWDVILEVADEALPDDTTFAVTVEDVAPTVVRAQATPQFVHRNQGRQIMVTIRVQDDNGFEDITGIRVDAIAAGGGISTLGNGLAVVAQGPDWIDVQLDQSFAQTDNLGQHPIPVTVTDEAHSRTDSTFLHVGNLAPVIEGYGMIFDADSVSDADHPSGFVLVKPKGLCPGDHFSAGPIASDPEGDSLVVVGEIVETGAKVAMRHARGSIWIADMTAPDTPGEYTVRITVSEVPPDKSTSVEMKITVIDCGKPKEDPPQVGLAVPANADDVAAASPDRGSQLMFGAITGGMIGTAFGRAPEPAGGGPGPSVELLVDSLALLLGGIEGTGLPPVETYVLATGGSTGPVAQMFAINRETVPLRFASQVVVLEPVMISPAIQARVTELLQRFVAAGGQARVLNAYCLEFLRQPPAAGTLMRIATADIATPFAPLSGILDAADRVRDGIGLHPDSDPTEYFHAIRQWSIWTAAERFDPRGFADAFVSTTRRNVEAAGQAWSDELEQAVRRLAPNRWTDVQAVLREAGIPEP